MGFESPSHWIILIVVAALLFGGYKKLPEMSRSVGRSLRIFKTEMKGLTEDDEAREAAERAKTGTATDVQQAEAPAVPVVPVAPVSQQVPPVAVPPVTPPAPEQATPASGQSQLPHEQ
ncbi:MAG TPA: Sec-independent protein translocase subunit TatA [Jatrophihabitans sp.]|nr:Sec-independent protein translocase subunit TatA [Jatrophihabitans sp.]